MDKHFVHGPQSESEVLKGGVWSGFPRSRSRRPVPFFIPSSVLKTGTRRNKLKTDASPFPPKNAKDSFGLRGVVGRIKSLGRSTALIFQRQKFWNIYLSLRRVTCENALTESENGRPRLVVEAYGRVISNSLSLQASCMSLDFHRLHSRRGFVFQVRAKARISSE